MSPEEKKAEAIALLTQGGERWMVCVFQAGSKDEAPPGTVEVWEVAVRGTLHARDMEMLAHAMMMEAKVMREQDKLDEHKN